MTVALLMYLAGTTVTASHLFKNLPVRRQMYSSKKKQREETRRVEDLLVQYAIVCPQVRFVLKVDRAITWQKPAMADHRSVLLSVWGSGAMAHMDHLNKHNTELEVGLQGTSQNTCDWCLKWGEDQHKK